MIKKIELPADSKKAKASTASKNDSQQWPHTFQFVSTNPTGSTTNEDSLESELKEFFINKNADFYVQLTKEVKQIEDAIKKELGGEFRRVHVDLECI